jgi:hypothetical protein
MRLRYVGAVLAGLACIGPSAVPASLAAEPAKTAISEEANAAVQQMGKTLAAADMSFTGRTIRVYEGANGQPLHIFHTMTIVAHRPDRLAIKVTGDDGSQELLYDGKTVTLAGFDKTKYAQMEAPNTIAAMLEEVVGRLGVDFPLADLLAPAPHEAFLSGVTTGSEVNTVTIDGAPYRHLFFTQPPGIDLELWVSKNEQALPARLVVTYRMLPGQPNLIVEFSDWKFGTRHPDSEFTFQPPPGASKVDLRAAITGPEAGGNKR